METYNTVDEAQYFLSITALNHTALLVKTPVGIFNLLFHFTEAFYKKIQTT